ncbi:MAG: DEAD/DEAH box helicase family protein [Candidatus Parcubacteria bacterium]|nr:DEAD/DEAH box helicase family protein [Candidatus Parcubacteria bacterium]
MEYLYEKLNAEKTALKKHVPEVVSIPKYVSDNLKYEFFDWQREAFENLLLSEKDHKEYPTHLMFNMATGTGKTLLMAGAILYYYKQGYRKFIFFVNQNNIVDKTENNFIDTTHSKYVFKEKIIVDGKTVEIKKVNTFSNNADSIEIKFTTVQKLYNDIHIERENQIFLDDLKKKDIVMLADEGHHLNADTKKIGQIEIDLKTELRESTNPLEIEKKGWEHTVIELLLNRNGKSEGNKNVLLEFTATIPENQKVIDKYAPITVYKFDLKQFLSAGYTKEINLLSSTLEKKERILQVLVFNWYRHTIALKNGISNFKPVILFRSKTIDESKTDFADFLKMVQNLKASDFDFLKGIESKFNESEDVYEQGKSRVLDVIDFMKKEKVKTAEIVEFIKYHFAERNCIITNSKTNTAKTAEKTDADQEKLLNSLEDKHNHIRAIFTVNRLTEGWDVLNLYDIVRLYTGRDESKTGKGDRKAGSATVSEIQLIGRGVRYCPFPYKDTQRNKRKFDEDLKHELRVLEELFYHSESDHRYITELKRELKERGFIDDGKIRKTFRLKDSFMKSGFYKDVKVWKNEQIANPERRKKSLNEAKFVFPFDLLNFGIKEQELDFESKDTDKERLSITESGLKTVSVKVKDFEKHIFYKALNDKAKADSSLFRFELLKEEIEIESIEDFRTGFIGGFEIRIVTKDKEFDDITNKEKFTILSAFFDRFLIELQKNINPFNGSDFTAYKFNELFDEAKEKSVLKDVESQQIEDDLKYEDWYALDQFYGTSEEKSLIKFVKDTIGNLQKKYKEVYLLRNEEQYKIFDFKTGQGFQPDFLLFLGDAKKQYYQVFIEPKGDNLLEKDKWKDDFLKAITKKYPKGVLKKESKEYILIGLPLYNEKLKQEFMDEYDKLYK